MNCNNYFDMTDQGDSFETWQGLRGPAGPQGPAGADGTDGSNGVTFTPAVSSAGVISWTNDGSLPNPDPVDIKGPQGETGQTGPAGPGVPSGGSTGQVLKKKSATDYDTEWANETTVDSALSDSSTNPVQNKVVKAALDNKADIITDTVSGAVANFPDGADGLPLESLVVQIEPVQSGSGDPSPDNVRPISGWTGCEVNRTGVNLWDEEWEVGGIGSSTGEPTSDNNRIRSKNFIQLNPSTTFYAVSDGMSSNDFRMYFYDKYKNFVGVGSWQYSSTFTTPTNAYYGKFVRVGTTTYNNNISINYPATDTTYHAYTGETIPVSWQTEAGTVYYGKLTINEDGTGSLQVDAAKTNLWESLYQYTDSKGCFRAPVPNAGAFTRSIGVISNCFKSKAMDYFYPFTEDLCIALGYPGMYANEIVFTYKSYTDVESMRTALQNLGAIAIYKLKDPVTYQLTAQQVIDTIYGTNNVWADCGDVEITYRADTKLYIAKAIAAAVAAL